MLLTDQLITEICTDQNSSSHWFICLLPAIIDSTGICDMIVLSYDIGIVMVQGMVWD